MRKTKTYFNKGPRLISLMLLLGFLSTSAMGHAQSLIESPKNQIRPEIKTRLESLQRDVEENGRTFRVGYSPAMEYTLPQLCGLVEPKDWRRHAIFEEMEGRLMASPSDKSFDWRVVLGPDATPPVKNQGGCGSCWAFGTVAPLETLISFHCGKLVALSEQYLVSCNQSNWGCQGGWFAHDYHEWLVPTSKGETDAGAVLGTSFSYKASNAACGGPHSHPYKITDWRFIAGNTVPSVGAIKQTIQTYGPVSVAVCVGSNFQAYRSGIFNANETCSGTVNHAVALVGWEDDLGPDNGYWILKNSWGTGWGEGGYMRIRYGTSKVGYAANFINFTGANCPDSTPPPSFDCSAALPINPGETKSGQTTPGTPSNASSYGCGGRNESGPEVVYQVTTTSTGTLTASLSNLGANDLDVYILRGCNPTNSCVAFGETLATYANAPPGTYYVVVEGNNGAAGQFDLQVELAQPLPDLTGSWVQLTPYSGGRTVYATLKLSNVGNAKAGAFKVAYYLSTGQFLGTQTASSGLAVGKDLYFYPKFSSSSSFSGKSIMAKIDYDGRVVEKDETNNLATGQVKSLRR